MMMGSSNTSTEEAEEKLDADAASCMRVITHEQIRTHTHVELSGFRGNW